MADVITRFKLETTQYDSKLRDAAKGLSDYTKQATMAGREFGKFTQSNIETARALGSITPSATNAKDKVKELVGAFNDAAKAYNALTKEQQSSDFGKALAQSLSQLNVRIREAKQEFYGMGDAMNKAGGGLFSGMGDKMSGALQVFAGNMMTKAAGAVANLGSEMVGMVKQGAELARQGEGIRIAFERLGRGDILDGLRQATHGTVTDLELMKAAVKFNDFKLPVEELGTMLAFAQQKAKDTGQSVDYMVDSIVTGLGRKSLMILDNLGLSATEVKDKMKETGDMTKAVGEIIREQMAKAGGYVETAADRAAQANVSLQNKMEELGRKFAPIEEASSRLWTSMKTDILDVIDGPLMSLLNYLNQASRSAEDVLTESLQELGPNVDDKGNYIKRPAQKGAAGFDWEKGTWKPGYSGAIYNAATGQTELPEVTATGTRRDPKKKPPKKVTKPPKTEEQLNSEKIQALTQEYLKATEERKAAIRSEIKVLQDRNAEIQRMKDEATGKWKPVNLTGASPGQGVALGGVDMPQFRDQFVEVLPPVQQLEAELERLAEKQAQAWSPEVFADYQREIDKTKEKLDVFKGIKKDSDNSAKSFHSAASAIGSVGNALNSIEDPTAKIMGIIAEAIAGVAAGAGQAISAKDTTSSGWAWIGAAAAITASMVAMITEIHNATGFAHGGVIEGTSFSGDNQWARVNAGETILNRAQTGIIASALQDSARTEVDSSSPYVTGETIILGANNHLKRSGQGEIVTTGMLRRMGII